MEILLILVGLAAGMMIGWLLTNSKNQSSAASLHEQLSNANNERATLAERSSQLKLQADSIQNSLEQERKINTELNKVLERHITTNETLAKKLTEQKAELEELQNKFKTEFENIANRILEEKSKKFTDQNRANLDIVLNPLKEKIKEFEDKVDRTYKIESNERVSLKEQIKILVDQNKTLSEDANNLTRALKGDVKKQGNWGEIILEKILERSGLEKGREYRTQESFLNEDGRRIQPDVIILLPDNKNIIVDSKVSLVAYEAMVNSSSEADREQFISQHVNSVKNHIKNLGEKKYHIETGLDTPDFVLMFMPIESSFSSAIQADNELFNFAWERKIVIVSPSTLLATLRTIASIWKQERQTRNALDIAERAGRLYDKFVGFTDDLLKVGNKLIESRKSYEDAMKKLSEGSGNLVSSVEKLRELGAKTSKQLPPPLIERAEENLL